MDGDVDVSASGFHAFIDPSEEAEITVYMHFSTSITNVQDAYTFHFD